MWLGLKQSIFDNIQRHLACSSKQDKALNTVKHPTMHATYPILISQARISTQQPERLTSKSIKGPGRQSINQSINE